MQSATEARPKADAHSRQPAPEKGPKHTGTAPTAAPEAEARQKSARRLAMEEARRSKRPSRADRQAGTTERPDRTLDDAGFPRLLQRTLTAARAAGSTRELVDTLVTLGGRLDTDTAWRSLTRAERAAVRMLTAPGRLPGPGEPGGPGADGPGGPGAVASGEAAGQIRRDSVFTSTLALTPQGRLVVTVPQRRSLPAEAAATGVAARISWSREDLAEYVRLFADVRRRTEHEVAECRALLAELGQDGRTTAVDAIRGAVFLVPPVMLYKDDSVYSNLKDEKNLTGKSLLPTHPDCFFHHLDRLPLELWTDEEAVVVACLWLAYSSGGPNRVESFNGVQLTLENVADNFRTTRAVYLEAAPELVIDELPDVELPAVQTLLAAAAQISAARARLVGERRIHYDINATIRRKSERALPRAERPGRHELGVCERLTDLLPGAGRDFASVLDVLDDGWLQAPRDGFATGFEALVHSTVAASVELFGADFAMSRGIRSLPRLVDALGRRDWAEIVSWELPDFYCCVVPSARAFELHGGDKVKVADSAWAMAARMQYNTWHVMPGNLPKDPAVQARDFLAPHVLPDLAVHSDLHHRGHVANLIRFSARSPEPVRITEDITFKSLTDLRVLRCTGEPFDQADLVGVTHVARFLAQLSERVAAAAVAGRPIEVTSFDHRWHRTSIAGPVPSQENQENQESHV